MAASLLVNIHLILFCLNTLIKVAFLRTSDDFCGRVFEAQVDHALVGHNISSDFVGDEFECQVKCIDTKPCDSFNVHPATGKSNKRVCELSNITRQMEPSDFKAMKGSNYYGSIKVKCVDISHEKGRKYKDSTHSHEKGRKYKDSTHCHTGYKGKRCQPTRGLYSHLPAQSCKDILDSGDSFGDGKYWIDPKKTGNPLKVYCDMTTNGGGWLLISNIVMKSSTPPTALPVKTSYRGIASDEMVLSKTASKELFAHLSFRQIRFYCGKKGGRIFHVGTVTNSSGESVVRYFTGQTDVRPSSCGSFVRMENDNSKLAAACQSWYEGKWGDGNDENRLYQQIVWWFSKSHWLLYPPHNRWECDDFNKGVSAGDFWKIYVR
ncbi:uncharacterized protein [Montipora foliosa]|uniref:uncharacterized protein isoform X2 n=1 Tax=Montipora foliosa TaxID=591990 RepID=UPI0035F1B550